MEVKWPEWRGGGQEGLGRPTGGSFNKSLAGDGASSFQVAVQAPKPVADKAAPLPPGRPGLDSRPTRAGGSGTAPRRAAGAEARFLRASGAFSADSRR